MFTNLGAIKLKSVELSIFVLMGVSIITKSYPDAGRAKDPVTIDLTKNSLMFHRN